MYFHDDEYRRAYREIMKIAADIEKSDNQSFCATAGLMCDSNAVKVGKCGYRNKLAAHITKMWSACGIMARMRAAELNKVWIPPIWAKCSPETARLIGLRS